MAGNILQWLAGGTKSREQQDMRQAWVECEDARSRSLLGKYDSSDLAFELVRDRVIRTADRLPVPALVEAMLDCAQAVFEDEDIEEFTPRWEAIDTDVSLAVRFRKMVARRRRYATDFGRIHGLVCERLTIAFNAIVDQLPPSCLDLDDEDEERPASFEVPLIELLEDPAELISLLIVAPYTDDTLALDLFAGIRGTYTRNIIAASGLPPDTNPIGNEHRMKMPGEQRGKSVAELVEMYLAGTPFQALLETPVPFSVPETSRFEHCHIIGGTGHGKTQLMQRMIYGDLEAASTEKRSVVVIDSQGDMISRLQRLWFFDPYVEDTLADRLVVIDPADVEFPASLNLFDAHTDRLAEYSAVDRERVLNGVVELYETFFGALLGAELTQKQGVVFKYLARLMLTIPGATIHTLMQLMEDGKPFKPHMDALEGSAKFFFATEFFHPSFAATKKQILRRLWGVLATPAFERMFAQEDNKLDLFQAMQDGKIILISTAKDLLKREGSALFGQFFIAMIAQAALERSTVSPDDRTPTLVYVDEAQEYFGDDVETILNQARKYRVGLTLAHQTLDQLSPRLRSVLHANTTMKCVGGVSSKDARAMADELHTTTEFVESMRRREGKTEFAAWIKHQTPHAIRLTAPLGFLERQDVLTEELFDGLLARNRERYCGTLADVPKMEVRTAVEEELRPQKERRQPPPPQSFESADGVAAEPAAPDEAVVVEPPEPRAQRRPPESGKGGAQHRYVQHLIKQLAEERGFRAVVEEQVPGGSVDVGLHRDELSIACEISITSTPDYEVQNLAKCLAAGFARVWAVAPDQKRRRAVQKAAMAALPAADVDRITFLTTEEMVVAFDEFAPVAAGETLVRGYKVSVSRKVVPPAEALERKAAVARIMAQSLGADE